MGLKIILHIHVVLRLALRLKLGQGYCYTNTLRTCIEDTVSSRARLADRARAKVSCIQVKLRTNVKIVYKMPFRRARIA